MSACIWLSVVKLRGNSRFFLTTKNRRQSLKWQFIMPLMKQRGFVGCRVYVCSNEVAYEIKVEFFLYFFCIFLLHFVNSKVEIKVFVLVQSQSDTNLPGSTGGNCLPCSYIADFRSSKRKETYDWLGKLI